MFELTIMLSRPIFIFLIAYFLLLGLLCIANERDVLSYNRDSAVFHQRFVIIATHTLAFIIMSFNPAEFSYDMSIASIGLAFFAVYAYSLIIVRFFYKESCPLIWNGVFYLLDIGLIMLTRLDPPYARKQLIWIFIGISMTIVIPFFFKFLERLEKLTYVYLAFSLILVTLPFLFGKTVYGAMNWVNILGVTFQPSEIAKFFYVFYLASVFCEKKSLTDMIFPTLMAGLIVICLVLQRDFGGALIFFMTYLVIVYISTASLLIVGSGIIFACVAAVVSYSRVSHIQRRVEAWANPWNDISDTGYQIARSLFAIGTWGALGSGLTRGYPYWIPVVNTDLIFSAVCEEFGILFGIMLIGVLILVLFRGIVTSLRSGNDFFCILAAAITGMLAFQSFLILGGVTKLIPLTGVTLPFVSYGGSSILVCIIMAGILAQLSKMIAFGADKGVSDEE